MHIFLQSSLIQSLIPDLDELDTDSLFLVEVEAKHIPHIKPEVVKIFRQLLLTLGVVALAPPDFKLNYILLTEIIDYNISPGLISGLGFDVVVVLIGGDLPDVKEPR